MTATAYLFNPFLHPDLVLYPRPGAALEPNRLLPTYAQDLRVGAGAYTGAMAHHLGLNIEYLDWVGDDIFGQFTLTELTAAGHGIGQVRRFHGDHMVCVSVADSLSAGGTMIASYPPPWRRSVEDFALLLEGPPPGSLVYVYSWLWSFPHPELADAATAELIQLASTQCAHRIVMDPNWKPAGPPPRHDVEQLLQALSAVNVFLPNRRDAEQLVGKHSPVETVRRLLDLGPAVVVLKDGHNGSYLGWQESRQILAIPAADVAVRDTTGAGDYFGGAYLAQFGPEHQKVAFANAAAALAISRSQGAPLPPRQAIEDLATTLVERTKEVS